MPEKIQIGTEKMIAEEKAAADKLERERKAKEAAAIPKPTPADDLISKANVAAARQEEANKKHEELLVKEEQLKVDATLGGRSEAGKKEKTQDDLETEKAREMLKGTGYDSELFPTEEEKAAKNKLL